MEASAQAGIPDELRTKLRQHLPIWRFTILPGPDPAVPGSEAVASWYDYQGVTFSNEAAEQDAINAWLAEQLGRSAGHPIVILRQSDGNGHCMLWFKKA